MTDTDTLARALYERFSVEGHVSYIEISRFPSHKEAVIAEKSAIASELPIYNIDGNKLLVRAGSLEEVDQ